MTVKPQDREAPQLVREWVKCGKTWHTKTTALQYAREGIRCNSVHPGPIVTPMTERRRAEPAVYQRMLSRIPLGRYGEPDEVAYAVLYPPTSRPSSPAASW